MMSGMASRVVLACVFALLTVVHCQDVNKCHHGNKCNIMTSNCVMRNGAAVCQCKTGYKLGDESSPGKQRECEDIDECLSSVTCDLKSSVCFNRNGSYSCNCLPGFMETQPGTCMSIKKYMAPKLDVTLYIVGALGICIILFTLFLIYKRHRLNEERSSHGDMDAPIHMNGITDSLYSQSPDPIHIPKYDELPAY